MDKPDQQRPFTNFNMSQELHDTIQRLREVIPEIKQKTKTDLFGHAPVKVGNIKTPSIVIEMGITPEDCVIKTVGGEVLDKVIDMKIEVNADKGYNTATLTFLSPKIVQRTEPEENVDPLYKRATSVEQLDAEKVHERLLKNKSVTEAKHYTETGAPL